MIAAVRRGAELVSVHTLITAQPGTGGPAQPAQPSPAQPAQPSYRAFCPQRRDRDGDWRQQQQECRIVMRVNVPTIYKHQAPGAERGDENV